ncbi:MAG: nuclease, partial [Acidobacteria bacterium]|nr:nuclease [Acidobacteriota bacterium]
GTYVGVTATVQEFIPSADPSSPSVTELIRPTLTFSIAGFALPAATTITDADAGPTTGIFNLEKYEGMRVSVPSVTVIAPTSGINTESSATSTSNGVFYGVITQTPALPRPVREPGLQIPDPLPPGAPASIPRYDANPERIRVDSDGLVGGTAIDVTTGAVVTGLVGPLDYSFRSYTVLPEPSSLPTVTGGIAAIPVPAAGVGQFTVASANMERFFDTVDDAGISDVRLTDDAFARRLNKASLMIRDVMRMPDLIGVEEMENLTALRAVAAKVNADETAAGRPSPQYEAILLEGNDIGGIDVGVLYKSGRVTVDGGSVLQIGKEATFVDPAGNVALLNDRPSLLVNTSVHVPGAAEFPLTLIVNHLRSLSGVDDPADGNRVRHKRQAQAEYLANFVQMLQAADPAQRIVLVGDFNAFAFNDGYVDVMGTIKGTPTPADQVTLASPDLVNPDLIDLVERAPADQQYSFVFDGTAQELDHVLITQNLLPFAPRLEYARNNADFPEVYRTDANRPERISDHDPIVAFFNVPLLTTIAYTGVTSVEAGAPAAVSAVLTDRATDAPVAGETITFTTAAATASAITGASGTAATTLTLPVGTHALTVAFAGDGARFLRGSSTTAVISVVDTVAPAITSVTSSVTSLWPPNKAMMPVGITVAAVD